MDMDIRCAAAERFKQDHVHKPNDRSLTRLGKQIGGLSDRARGALDRGLIQWDIFNDLCDKIATLLKPTIDQVRYG